MSQYTLQPYTTPSSRYHCPACNSRQRTFVRYINTQTGEHLADNVGRCGREDKCGYHYKPRDYFNDNPHKSTRTWQPGNGAYPYSRPQGYAKRHTGSDYATVAAKAQLELANGYSVNPEFVNASFNNYEHNYFVQYLISRFGRQLASNVIGRFRIGSAKYWPGATVFWQIDVTGRVRTGKIMLYDAETGRRVKQPFNHVMWVHKLVGSKQWAVGSKQWAVGSEQWAVGSEKQLAVGSKQWAVGSEKQLAVGSEKQMAVGSEKQLAVGSEQWAVGSGEQQAVGSEQWAVGSGEQQAVGREQFAGGAMDVSCNPGTTQLFPKETANCPLPTASFLPRQCFFGEHQLNDEPQKPVAIVESEKTAIIASLYNPEVIWLATGGKSNLNQQMSLPLKNRHVTLYPDLGSHSEWSLKGKQLQSWIPGAVFTVSDLIEKIATPEQRAAGWDLGDYL